MLLGLAVLASPWLLAFSEVPAPTWNAVIVGSAIVMLSAFAIARLEPWEEWLNIGLGLWLIVSSWVLDYGAAHQAIASHVSIGLLITLLAASELWEESQGRATAEAGQQELKLP
ncbi:SPW repeat protein [Ferrovibrio terrae]|uniref:SPW repeat protein n=1 Tax=Ferrovibrio terrae TaxID=2594003 RepID=UPI003137C5D8